MNNQMQNPLIIRLLALSTLTLTFFMYFPGLNGEFIFDDVSNLRHISVFNQYNGFEALINFILSNEAGILKRPISTLSFLLNSTTWPTEAYYFKLTNVIIHLFNGLLLYLVTCKLLIQLNIGKNKIKPTALLNMALWLLNPYFVSTTLYVVQRMTMLSTLFVLIGIFYYLKARENAIKNRVKCILYLIVSVDICTLLATLSKENGIILPILLLMLEFILSKINKRIKLGKVLNIIFLTIPSLFIFFAFLYKIPDFLESYNLREFSVIERLLTQPRVVLNYLYHLFIPNYLTESVYTDGFTVSSSLLKPLSTLFSLLSLLALLMFSILKYKKYPIISLSILFFFTALLIESTIVPLEIYFEHRSYLPSLFIFLPLSVFLINGIQKSNVFLAIITIILGYLSLSTYLRSDLWSNNNKLISITSLAFPKSVRAVNRKASLLFNQGHALIAIKLLENSSRSNKNLNIRLNILYLKCSINQPIEQEFLEFLQILKIQNITKNDRAPLISVFNLLSSKNCMANSINAYHRLVQAIKHNKGYNNPAIKSTIDFHEAYVLLKKNDYEGAFILFNHYLDEYINYEDIIYVSEELIDVNQDLLALRLLERLHSKLKQNIGSYIDNGFLEQSNFLIEKIKQKH